MPKQSVRSEFEGLGALVSEFLELTRESDRGAILVAGAMLDARLEQAIRSRLRDDLKAADGLFGVDGPVGSFSAKIKLAYLLGLVTKSEQRELDLVRRIRNEAAHSSGAATFDAFADRIAVLSQRVPAGFGAPHITRPLAPRDKFLLIVADLTSALEQSAGAAERLTDVHRPAHPFCISELLRELSRMLPVLWDHLPSMLPDGGTPGPDLSLDQLSAFLRRLLNIDGANSPEAASFALYLRHSDQQAGLMVSLGNAERTLDTARAATAATTESQSSTGTHVDRWASARSSLKRAQEAFTKWQEQLQVAVSSSDVTSTDVTESIDASAARAVEAYSAVVTAFSRAGLALPEATRQNLGSRKRL